MHIDPWFYNTLIVICIYASHSSFGWFLSSSSSSSSTTTGSCRRCRRRRRRHDQNRYAVGANAGMDDALSRCLCKKHMHRVLRLDRVIEVEQTWRNSVEKLIENGPGEEIKSWMCWISILCCLWRYDSRYSFIDSDAFWTGSTIGIWITHTLTFDVREESVHLEHRLHREKPPEKKRIEESR